MFNINKKKFMSSVNSDCWVEKDSYELQVTSLELFLAELGYKVVNNPVRDTWHIKKCAGNKIHNLPMFLSLDLAVALHNDTVKFKVKKNTYSWCGISFPKELFREAEKSRLLETIYLQRVNGEWKQQRNLIKFTDNNI